MLHKFFISNRTRHIFQLNIFMFRSLFQLIIIKKLLNIPRKKFTKKLLKTYKNCNNIHIIKCFFLRFGKLIIILIKIWYKT